MKTKTFFLLALILAFVNGWASPLDSLKINPNTTGITDKLSGLELADEKYDPDALSRFDGLTFIDNNGDGIINSSDYSGLPPTKIMDVTPQSLSFPTLTVFGTEQKSITVTTINISNNMSVSLSGDKNAVKMFSINKSTLNYNNTDILFGSGEEIKVTYKPTAPGNHTVNLVISEKTTSRWRYTKSITLTGKAVNPSPYVVVSKKSLHFYQYDTQSFKVTGYYLSSGLSLVMRGTGKGYFSLSKLTITKSAAESGAWVNVTCSPKNALRAVAYIDIFHNNKLLKTVTLSYAKNQALQSPIIQPGDEQGDVDYSGEVEASMFEMVNSTTGVDEIASEAKIFAEGRNIVIESPMEQSAVISDVAGRAWTVNLQVGRNEIPVNASGIFIVRVREKTAKLMLR